jgi:hypothetical protein
MNDEKDAVGNIWLQLCSAVRALNKRNWHGGIHFSFLVRKLVLDVGHQLKNKQTLWSESASELYRPSDRRLSAK